MEFRIDKYTCPDRPTKSSLEPYLGFNMNFGPNNYDTIEEAVSIFKKERNFWERKSGDVISNRFSNYMLYSDWEVVEKICDVVRQGEFRFHVYNTYFDDELINYELLVFDDEGDKVDLNGNLDDLVKMYGSE
jgi:hypothetical protein